MNKHWGKETIPESECSVTWKHWLKWETKKQYEVVRLQGDNNPNSKISKLTKPNLVWKIE